MVGVAERGEPGDVGGVGVVSVGGEVKLDMASRLTLGAGLPITEMAQLGPTGYRSPQGTGGVPGAAG